MLKKVENSISDTQHMIESKAKENMELADEFRRLQEVVNPDLLRLLFENSPS